jgi:hypothetical protein
VGVLGCVAVDVTGWRMAGWGGMWLGGRPRRFDSHQLNCAFISSFLFFFFSFSFRFVIPHMFTFSYFIFHISYFIFHISYFIFHISYFIFHISYFIFHISYFLIFKMHQA